MTCMPLTFSSAVFLPSCSRETTVQTPSSSVGSFLGGGLSSFLSSFFSSFLSGSFFGPASWATTDARVIPQIRTAKMRMTISFWVLASNRGRRAGGTLTSPSPLTLHLPLLDQRLQPGDAVLHGGMAGPD